MTARKYDSTCSYPDCGRPHNSRGLCNSHGVMQRKGQPLRPIQGRTGPVERSEVDRFVDKVALRPDGCLVWIGGRYPNGYGSFAPSSGTTSRKKLLAHRWSYEWHVGPVPNGLQLDHLCRNRACVNPDHLEPVTAAENIRRAFAGITHCPSGHRYDAKNSYINPTTGHRACRACGRARDIERSARRNAQRRLWRAEQKKAS